MLYKLYFSEGYFTLMSLFSALSITKKTRRFDGIVSTVVLRSYTSLIYIIDQN